MMPSAFLGSGLRQALCAGGLRRSQLPDGVLNRLCREPYNDLGRFQTLFEYESLMAELLDTEVVSVPTFDWSQAAPPPSACPPAYGPDRALITGTINPDRFAIMKNYCDPIWS